MAKKSTDELENILGQTSTTNIEACLAQNAESLLNETNTLLRSRGFPTMFIGKRMIVEKRSS